MKKKLTVFIAISLYIILFILLFERFYFNNFGFFQVYLFNKMVNCYAYWSMSPDEKLTLEISNCHNSKPEKILHLVKAGANPNLTVENKNPRIPFATNTPLICIVEKDNIRLATEILNNGADINLNKKDIYGFNSALTRAVKAKNIKMVKFLINNGAKLNPDDGMTPIMAAVKNSDLNMAKFLVKKRAKISNDDKYWHSSLLEEAAKNNNLNMMKFLLKNGASLNPESGFSDNSPLKIAIKNNNFKIVKFLMEKGYDPFQNSNRYHNDYKYIIDNGSFKVFKYVTKNLIDQKINLKKTMYSEAYMSSILTYYSPFEDILATHDYKKIMYIKSLGVDFSQNDFANRIRNLFNEIDVFPVFLKLIGYGYPTVTKERSSDYINFVITDLTIIDYIELEPVESFETIFQVYKEFSNKTKIPKDIIFRAMEIHLDALLEVNYQEEIIRNPERYSYDYIFKNKSVEKRGSHIQIDYSEEHNCKPDQVFILNIQRCAKYLDPKTNYEENLWTLKKFYFRRGEFIGNLCIYYALQILDFEKNRNREALRLYVTYGKDLQNRYNKFASNWNKGIYSFNKFDNIEFLKTKYKKIPLSTLSFSAYRGIKPLKKGLYFKYIRPLDYYRQKMEQINNIKDYKTAYKTILNDDLNGGETRTLAKELLLRAKHQNMPESVIQNILIRCILPPFGSGCNYYDCIETEKTVFFEELCDMGLYDEALYFFNNECDYCKPIKDKKREQYLPFSKIKNKKLTIELPFKLQDYFKKDFILKIFNEEDDPVYDKVFDSSYKVVKLTLNRSKNRIYGICRENNRIYRLKGFIGKYGNFVIDKYNGNMKAGTFIGHFDSPDRITGKYRAKNPGCTDNILVACFDFDLTFIGVTGNESMEAFRKRLKQEALKNKND